MFAAKELLRSSVPTTTIRWTSRFRLSVLAVRMLTVPAATPEGSGQPPKQFKDIPGPKGYPLIGTALDYRNDKYTMSRVMKRRLDKFGHIYREKVFPGLPEQVVIVDPEDVAAVFRADPEWPNRPVGGEIFQNMLKESGINTAGILTT